MFKLPMSIAAAAVVMASMIQANANNHDSPTAESPTKQEEAISQSPKPEKMHFAKHKKPREHKKN